MSFNWNNSLFKWSTSHSPPRLTACAAEFSFQRHLAEFAPSPFLYIKKHLAFPWRNQSCLKYGVGCALWGLCSNRHFHIRLHCSIRTFGGVTAWWFRNHPRIYAIRRQLITSRFGQFWDSCRTAVDGGILRAFTLFSACRQFRSIIGWLLSSHLVSVQYIIGIIGAHVMRWCQGPHQS
jgi:hypothetical protein